MSSAGIAGLRDASLLLYCRAGFEDECAKEIAAAAGALGVSGFVRGNPAAAYVEFVPHDIANAGRLRDSLRYDALVFARQLVFVFATIDTLSAGDRIGAMMPSIAAPGLRFSALWLETADTNEAKELGAFCRRLGVPLAAALQRAALLDEARADLPRLNLFFTSSRAVMLGTSLPGNSSPWPMGIPRLRMPARAPSRSTLKLAEALQLWLDPAAEAQLLHEGITAVDLGAAPGGWTFQLVRRGVQVTAVDNGPMDPALLDTGLVEHLRADGFRYRPRFPVQWMVCDIVEQPKRVAALAAEWLANGWCTRAIFNLKLPMKKRYDALGQCRALMAERWAAAGIDCSLRCKHLYHDREEVTAYAVRSESGLRPQRPQRGRKTARRPSDQAKRRS